MTPLARPLCERCQCRPPVREAAFHRHVGLFFVFFHRVEAAWMCARCLRTVFLRTTLITSLFGWFGLVSFFATIVSITLNVQAYVRYRFGWETDSDAPSNEAALSGMLYGFLQLKDPVAARALRLGRGPTDDPALRFGAAVTVCVLAAYSALWGLAIVIDPRSSDRGAVFCIGMAVTLWLGAGLVASAIARRRR